MIDLLVQFSFGLALGLEGLCLMTILVGGLHLLRLQYRATLQQRPVPGQGVGTDLGRVRAPVPQPR